MRPLTTRRITSTVLLTVVLGLLPAGLAEGAGARSQRSRTVNALGFDTCETPTVETMQVWRTSPYQVVGIYVAGDNRACKSTRLTRDWVKAVHRQGWDFLPIQVGLQAPCSQSGKPGRIDPAHAAQQGIAEANDAVARGAALGFKPGSALWYDMEAYDNTDAGCRTAVLDFVSAWSDRIRERGYVAGYYSSLSSGIADLIDAVDRRSVPDAVWYARWDDRAATTGDGALPDGYWRGRRVHQYTGNVSETHGGKRIDIDRNAVDGPVGVL
ncbi:glycoside hydrolase domain-containing protein [Embleya sp. NPDC005575]|uniref:glycoside hydrolase domain-containing protein n=1 Tax=Embleya sp. NPDC005575 TaxID=3156892 RepID=UPI0033B9E0C7